MGASGKLDRKSPELAVGGGAYFYGGDGGG
jgi:hypothetical protein